MNHCLVFIHLGALIPAHTRDALAQARLFNACPIYLLAAASALEQFPIDPALAIITVPCESLSKSSAHLDFERRSTLDRTFRNGFWRFTTERFFHLESLMRERALEHVIHLENDVTLYVDLQELLPLFIKHYPNLAGTFDNDQRCIPGFLYLRSATSLAPLTEFIAAAFGPAPTQPVNDMSLLADYRRKSGPAGFDCLPIVPPDYPGTLVSQAGHQSAQPEVYSQHADSFDSLFDAAALGQYLGGVDPRNSAGKDSIGFINESCLFNPSLYSYASQPDARGRSIPYLHTDKRAYRLNNLHIHSKNLHGFRSA